MSFLSRLRGESRGEKSNIPKSVVKYTQKYCVNKYASGWGIGTSTGKKNTMFFESSAYQDAKDHSEIIHQGAYKMHVALDSKNEKAFFPAIQCLFRDVISRDEFADLRFKFKMEAPASKMREGAGITIWIPPDPKLCGGDEKKAADLWYRFGLAIDEAFKRQRIATTKTTTTDKKLKDTEDCVVSYRIGPNGAGQNRKESNECYSLTDQFIGSADYHENRDTSLGTQNHNPQNWPDPIDAAMQRRLRAEEIFKTIITSIPEENKNLRKSLHHPKKREDYIYQIVDNLPAYEVLMERDKTLPAIVKKLQAHPKRPLEGFKEFQESRVFKMAQRFSSETARGIPER